MYKNQLQELAQRSCFNLPTYTFIRHGPDHAPRFKATVNFNGETFESPAFCTTLRQAEHSAAEVALNSLAGGEARSIAARIFDETGVYKNLLQEVSQRVGASLPIYKTIRSGHGHLRFTCIVELAGFRFTGEPAGNKKQAEKNAAMTAWFSLKQLVQTSGSSSSENVHGDEQEHVTVARSLQEFLWKTRISSFKPSFPIRFPSQSLRPTSPQPSPVRSSKILPLIYSKNDQSRPIATSVNTTTSMNPRFVSPPSNDQPLSPRLLPENYLAARASPYIPMSHFRPHRHAIAPPVTMRSAIPVFSSPSVPACPNHVMQFRRPTPASVAPPISLRQAIPVFAAPPIRIEERSVSVPPSVPPSVPSANSSVQVDEREKIKKADEVVLHDLPESSILRELLELEI